MSKTFLTTRFEYGIIDPFCYGSSRPEEFCKKGILKNFAKFTGKQLCQSLLFNKAAGLKPAILLKRKLWHRCFLMNFCETFKNTFFVKHLRWLLLLLLGTFFSTLHHYFHQVKNLQKAIILNCQINTLNDSRITWVSQNCSYYGIFRIKSI